MYVAPGLKKVLIKYLLRKRIRMAANGSNCAEIDKRLKELGYIIHEGEKDGY